MNERNPLMVVALTLLTFGLYSYYWLYKTTDELKEETGRDDLKPGVDALLALLTLGLWGIYAGFRNAQIVHEEMQARGLEHRDRSLVVGGVAALSLVSGWAWIVAMGIAQEDLNRLAAARVDYFAEAEPYLEVEEAPVRARVDLEPEAEPALETVPAGDRWASAPSAPVFRSNAPMPTVF